MSRLTARRPSDRQRVPRPRWFLFGMMLAAFGAVLLADGLVHANVGNDAEGAVNRTTALASPEIRGGGSVIDVTAEGIVRSQEFPDRTVALTFDDGPDPTWTPQVLEVLRKHEVPGTFFVLGSHATENPELLREMRQSGFEIGIHTFSHPDLTHVSTDQREQEMSRSQLALAGAIGEVSYLVRPPYSSGASSLDQDQADVLRELAGLGYVTALSDIDSRDWEKAGTDAIVEASTPRDGQGGSILLHDAGGDRTQTVEALDELIPHLKEQGYRFTTVTEAVGLPPANQPAPAETARSGGALLASVGIAMTVVSVLQWALLVVGVLVLARLLIMVLVAGRHRRLRRDPNFSWGPPVTEPVSVIVPAYNERETITATVSSLAKSDHPIEVIVVDDGSTDGTGDLVEAMGLPQVRLIRQENAGKPAALNAGLAAARYEIVVMLDGDTIFEPETVRTLVQPFADPEIGAVAGNAKVANRRGLVARWQHIEYVHGFNIDRRVFDLWRCMPTVPGAIGAFRRRAVLAIGGVSDDTLAEDTDLTMALWRGGWRVVFEERARAWTEAPSTLPQLWRQRYRWSYGTMQSMWKHRKAVFESGAAGKFGRRGLAQMTLFQVVLPMLAPLIDVFAIYGLLFLDPLATMAAWSSVLVIQLIAAIYAFRLEREKLGVLWLLPLQQIVYRQLMYAVLVQSAASAFAGVRLRWQKLRRSGDFGAAPEALRQPAVRQPALHQAAADGEVRQPALH